jgi:uncharacterized protein (TIGR01777 family)
MKVLVSGASGLIGSALVQSLSAGGHEVLRLERRATPGAGGIAWDPLLGTIDRVRLAGLDAVVHLAGENISSGRWSSEKKTRIRRSRVDGTRLLVQALSALDTPPRTFLAASAIGYYGSRGDTLLDEDSAPGQDFLATVCAEWEAAARAAAERSMRVVNLRFGVVLSPAGGALAAMLTPFRLGLGGPVGNGQQYLSWIAIDDALAAIDFALARPELSGPVNTVSPNPVTSAEFARALGRTLHRPAFLPLPAAAVSLLFGEMGTALLLGSARVMPRRLLAAGFHFRFADLDTALRHLLG